MNQHPAGHFTQMCNVAFKKPLLQSGQKAISLCQKQPQKTKWLRKLTIYQNIRALLGPTYCISNPDRVQKVFPYAKMIVGTCWSTLQSG